MVATADGWFNDGTGAVEMTCGVVSPKYVRGELGEP